MALFNRIVFTLVIALILQSNKVDSRVISPQATTIKAPNGDIYDCVDFYKQPAFQHPLLRNHSFNPKMEPSSTPKSIDGEANTINAKEQFFGLKDGGCPFGTVPIGRVTKEQRDRATKFSDALVNLSSSSNALPTDPGFRFAVLQSKSGPATPNYYGIEGKFSVNDPVVNDNQFSSAQCMIRNGPDYIQFGWTVHPTIYGDKQTRMFIRTEAGTTHCYNTDCPGFVVVRSDLPLNAVLPKYSSKDELVMVDMLTFRDPGNGNWWFVVGDVRVGFWPGNILSNLAKVGTYIECGGEAYSPDEDPWIGTGYKPIGSLYYDAFVERFKFVNDKFLKVDAEDTEPFLTNDDKYDANIIGKSKETGLTLVYGGPNRPARL